MSSDLLRRISFKEFQHLCPMVWRAVHFPYLIQTFHSSNSSLYRTRNRKYIPRLPPHRLLDYLLVRFPLAQCILKLANRVTGVILIFVEIPLLMRICPTSEKFDTFVRRFNENWPRAGMYIVYLSHPPPTTTGTDR